MGPYFHQTNFDPLISNSGHLLFSNYCLKVVLGDITKPNSFFFSLNYIDLYRKTRYFREIREQALDKAFCPTFFENKKQIYSLKVSVPKSKFPNMGQICTVRTSIILLKHNLCFPTVIL